MTPSLMNANLSNYSYAAGVSQGFLKKNVELHIKSSDAVLKNEILVSVGIELPAFCEKG